MYANVPCEMDMEIIDLSSSVSEIPFVGAMQLIRGILNRTINLRMVLPHVSRSWIKLYLPSSGNITFMSRGMDL
jgi:hypothetical protein